MSSKSRRIARKKRKALKRAGLHFKGFGAHSDRRNEGTGDPLSPLPADHAPPLRARPRMAAATWRQVPGLVVPLHEPGLPDQAGQPA